MENDLYKIFENSKFNHKYFLKTFKGAGAFGAVFLADELVGDTKIQEVAIKAIRKDKMSSDNIAKELITAIRLKDPNLINCITSEEGRLKHLMSDYDCFGLVMEIASGTLEQYIRTNNPLQTKVLGVSEVTEIVREIASGLAFLHSQSITHRDLKPANVLQVGNSWKISDFGIARQMGNESGTLTTSLTGTPIYMPPEVYTAENAQSAVRVAPAWDIWSLGVMIVQMLTGELPFQELTDILLVKISIKGKLPAPFDRIVQQCLLEDPKQRWTAKEILAALNPEVARVRPNIFVPQPSISTPPTVVPASDLILTLPKNQKLELVNIPSGKLIMEGGHEVNLRGFSMGKYAITQGQYKAVMGNNPSDCKDNLQYPVEQVSWYDAMEFCEKLSRQTGEKVRLPSETEWEYACRAGTSTRYYFGDNDNDLKEYGWYGENSGSKTHPVGEKRPNRWSLYDMHGNVKEWCADKWIEDAKQLPKDGKAFVRNNNYHYRVLRGGSWFDGSVYCRSVVRVRYYAAVRNDFIGFRVVV
jgi:formylglycine-generating enzyme required for sulfatase activity